MDPFALTEESFRSLKAQAVEKLAAARGESAQQLKAASKADPSGSIKQQLEALARRALSRAQIKRVAGLELAERHGFPTVGHLSQHAATCPADEKAELLAELNALDRNGYGLLHYACLYNLSPLIPVLLGMHGWQATKNLVSKGMTREALSLAVIRKRLFE